MIERVVEVGILFDFYGKLLTDKQYQAIDLYYIRDLSLTEIGERLEVSRQGVFDLLKRAEGKLYGYEEKLKLVDKFERNREDIKEIIKHSQNISELLEENKNYNKNKINDRLDHIIELGEDLVNR